MNHAPIPTAPPALAADCGAEERRVEVDGISIRYLRAGAGPPIVLLHGLMGFSYSWRHNLRALAAHHTVYAPDFPGTGYSQRSRFDTSFSGIARVMLHFFDALALRDVDLLATSHGGAVAIMMAALDLADSSNCETAESTSAVIRSSKPSHAGPHHGAPLRSADLPLSRSPDRPRIRSLILVAPVNPYSRSGRKRILFFTSLPGALLVQHTPLLHALRGKIIERMYGDPARIADGVVDVYAAPMDVPGSMAHIVRMLKSWFADVHKLNAALDCIAGIPTLLVWGTRDRAVPPSSAEPLLRRFRHARLVWLEGAGHLPYEEVPDEFNRVVLDFLKRR